ncbi:hypothetical protein KFK09_002487 [Dendrobium nobile]|uniref:Uncharacterized protein n=1 Tax=Dendrobium nobile TaxID=94219 RepID=A0A8T3C1T0_DENNO|nr:hypothetical protein KFK09_002487 [Dendrobium nobile]
MLFSLVSCRLVASSDKRCLFEHLDGLALEAYRNIINSGSYHVQCCLLCAPDFMLSYIHLYFSLVNLPFNFLICNKSFMWILQTMS